MNDKTVGHTPHHERLDGLTNTTKSMIRLSDIWQYEQLDGLTKSMIRLSDTHHTMTNQTDWQTSQKEWQDCPTHTAPRMIRWTHKHHKMNDNFVRHTTPRTTRWTDKQHKTNDKIVGHTPHHEQLDGLPNTTKWMTTLSKTHHSMNNWTHTGGDPWQALPVLSLHD